MRDPLKSDICAVYLRAVAEPDRLRIVQCLRSGPKSVGEIAGLLGAALANVSHHLKFLRSARLVTTAKRGRHVMYSLAAEFARSKADGGLLDVLDFGCCRIELTQKQGKGQAGGPRGASSSSASASRQRSNER